MSVHTRDGGQKLVYDLTSVAPTNSMADVFRVFLQFASAEKDKQFGSIELGFRGRPKFLIRGDYFQQLGKEFGTQNPVYTIRTFPENVMKLDGSKAYPTWTGGFIGVSGKQMEDFNDFHRQWWFNDLAAASGGRTDPTSQPASPPAIPVSLSKPESAPTVPSVTKVDGREAAFGGGPKPTIEPSVPMPVPRWLSIPPGAKDEITTSSFGAVDISYTVSDSADNVVKYYREQLSSGGAASQIAFDGIGTSIQAARDHQSCVIRISEASEGTAVSAKCAEEKSDSQRVPAAAMPSIPPGAHLIEYSITGSAGAVGLTYQNASGGTEQRIVGLPSSMSFYSMPGRFVYVSAQNKTSSGDVHVSITVDGSVLQQATSSTAYGIATASGSVPR